jgi:DNA-binding transcriptional LysR family regulator
MTRPTLSQLETFFWIARLGSFHAAAERLGLSQPSISLRIRELERSLGTPLFHRRGRGVVLSEHGEVMLRHVEQVLAAADEMEAALAPMGSLKGIVRIGMPDSIAIACLGDMMRNLESSHRGLRLEISIDSSAGLLRSLKDRKLDIALVGEPPQLAGYRIEYVARNPIGWVAAPRLRLPAGVLGPRDLADFHLLTAPEFSSTYNIMTEWFSTDGIKPMRVSTCNSLSAIARLTADGIGISILPLSMLSAELRAGALKLLEFAPELPSRRLYAVLPEEPTGVSRRAVTAVLRALRETVARSELLVLGHIELT